MASFLKKSLGGKADNMIDQAVDQAATVAKEKVKTFMGQETKKPDQKGKGPGPFAPKSKEDFTPEAKDVMGGGAKQIEADLSDDLLNLADDLKG